MPWELLDQQLAWTEKWRCLRPCLYLYLGSYAYPGELQLFSLSQYLGENLLELPQGQEGLDLLWEPQTLGQVVLGKRARTWELADVRIIVYALRSS